MLWRNHDPEELRLKAGDQEQPDGVVELAVARIGARGDGIADHDGEPVFLPFTVPGDRVRARLGARRGGGREGRVVERLASRGGRADPPCPHFGRYGGCALQHLDQATYRTFKLGVLRSALERVAIDPDLVQPLRTVSPARGGCGSACRGRATRDFPCRSGFTSGSVTKSLISYSAR